MNRSLLVVTLTCMLHLSLGCTQTPADSYGSADEASAMLTRVVAALKSNKSAAIDMFNNGEGGFRDRDLYVFCIDASNGVILAQGGPLRDTFLGQDIRLLKDAVGKAYGLEIFAAAQKQEGEITEVSYMFPKPTAGAAPVAKISYVTRIGDIGCGVGYYESESATRD
jgi:hypothetical protein